jgi:hypothetical protein
MSLLLLFQGAVAAQTLTPGIVTDTDSVYAPTVTTTYTLTPGLFADTDTIPAPTVTAGAVTLTPSLVTDVDTIYAPTINAAVTLSPSLVAADDTFYTATIQLTDQVLLPGLVAADDAFYSPSVLLGQELAPGLVLDGDQIYAPAITTSVQITASLVVDTDLIYAPSIVGARLLPGLVTDVDVVYAPTMGQGEAAGTYVDPDLIYSPTLVSTWTIFESQRAIDQDVFYPPSVQSVLTISPPLVIDTFEQIIVARVSRTLAPARVIDPDTFFAPAVQGGDVHVFPPFVSDDTVIYVPAVQRQNSQGGGGGGGGGNVTKDIKYGSLLIMSQSGLITQLGAQISQAKPNVNTRMMVYDATTVDPATWPLLGKSGDKSGVTVGQNLYPLLVPVSRLAGQRICIALHTDANQVNWLLNNSPSGSRFNNDIFSDGPSNPFGAASIDNKLAPVLIIFLEQAPATISPPRVVDPDVFYTAIEATGITLTTSFVIADDSIYPPAVLSVNNIDAPHVIDADVLPAPSVVASIQIFPGLVIDSDIVLGPDVHTFFYPDQQVFSALMPSDDQIYAPTVTPMGADLFPPLVTDDDVIYPVQDVSPYNEVFIGDYPLDQDLFYAPIVSLSDYPLTPDLVIDADVIEPPEITLLGAPRIVTPEDPFTDVDVFYPPRISFPVHSQVVTIFGRRDSQSDIEGRSDKQVDIEGSADNTVDIEGET